jgi:predicted outer membrane repeat protein
LTTLQARYRLQRSERDRNKVPGMLTPVYAVHEQANGGALAIVGAQAQVAEAKFSKCTSAGSGGAIWASGFQFTVYPNIDFQTTHLSLRFCTFENNSALALGGGALHVKDTNLTLSMNVFSGNSADGGGGGGILWEGEPRPNVHAACGPGLFLGNGSYFCVPCEAGKYRGASVVEQCIPCESGKYNGQPGATSCEHCSEGLVSSPGSVKCQSNECNEGTFHRSTITCYGDCPCTDAVAYQGTISDGLY